MPNLGKLPAGPSTKSSDDSLVGFQLEELKTHYLPSIKELMQRVIYEKNQIKIKENKVNLKKEIDIPKVYNILAIELAKIWMDRSSIPCFCGKTLKNKLQVDLEDKFREISKLKSRIESNPGFKKEKKDELDKLYDIAKCQCFKNSKSYEEAQMLECLCSNGDNVIPELELDFYFRQIFKRSTSMSSGVDKKGTEDLNKTLAKIDDKNKKKSQKKSREQKYEQEKELAEMSRNFKSDFVESDEDCDEDVDDGDEDFDESDSKYESITDFDFFLEACCRFGKSQNGVHFILSALMMDLSIAIENGKEIKDLWRGRSTMQRKLQKMYQHRIKEHKDKYQKLEILGFDECEDLTLQIGNHLKKEKHLTMTTGKKYLDHATLKSKQGVDIMAPLYEAVENTDSKDSLMIVQADGTGETVFLYDHIYLSILISIFLQL